MSSVGQPSLRALAQQLNLSVATVSMALHEDPRVRPETAKRVIKLAESLGYQSDPIVSEALSRVRKGNFYRETLAWCFDENPRSLFWLPPLFKSTEEYGRHLGYKIEYFHFDPANLRTLKRLTKIWKARGIHGVLLGPFRESLVNPVLPWEEFVWVSLDAAVTEPALHQVTRDYDGDISKGLGLLTRMGCSRPGFVVERPQIKAFRPSLLRAALTYYYNVPKPLPEPYIEVASEKPRQFVAWLKRNRPDCLLITRKPPPAFLEMAKGLPIVLLSECEFDDRSTIAFGANYTAWGQSAANFMHRMLTTRQFGVPDYQQSVLISSIALREGKVRL